MEKVTIDRRRYIWGSLLSYEFHGKISSPVDQVYSSDLSKEKEITLSCSDAYISCYPNSSWEHLTSLLYEENEVAAIDEARLFLPPRG